MQRAILLSILLTLIFLDLNSHGQESKEGEPAVTNEIEVKEVKAQPVVQIRFKAKREEIGGKLGMAYGRIMAHIAKSGGEPTMMPLSRFYGEEDGVIDMAAAIAVQEPVNGEGDIESTELPAGNTVTAWHLGHYDKLPETYMRVTQWLTDHGHTVAGPSWEIYWTDPAAEPDPNKWQTQIFMPLAK
jgi:AraC family transcriptional regulator